MECKYNVNYFIHWHCSELIDTLWNVNSERFILIEGFISELIDTLWNVNVFLLPLPQLLRLELIDTLWNVNENLQVDSKPRQP